MGEKAVVYFTVITFCAKGFPREPPRVSLAFFLPSLAGSEDTAGKGRATIPFGEIHSWFWCVQDSHMAYSDTAANICKLFLKLCLGCLIKVNFHLKHKKEKKSSLTGLLRSSNIHLSRSLSLSFLPVLSVACTANRMSP